MKAGDVNIQGHRGARGLYPENTLTAFIEAIKLGVDTLEMDLVISADQQVVVSHEAWMNEDFCFAPGGIAVERDSKEKYNLYKMNYAEIKNYDCGWAGNPEFPLQKPVPEHKPLFSEVVLKVEAFIKHHHLKPISYNIEIKSEPGDNIFNPAPPVFVDLVYKEIIKHNLSDRLSVQSFDTRMLQQIRKVDPSIKTGLLIDNEDSVDVNLKRLGFTPDFYSPEFKLITVSLVNEVHQKNMKLTTWTVNEIEDMRRLMEFGVDGIITDYPDRAIGSLRFEC